MIVPPPGPPRTTSSGQHDTSSRGPASPHQPVDLADEPFDRLRRARPPGSRPARPGAGRRRTSCPARPWPRGCRRNKNRPGPPARAASTCSCVRPPRPGRPGTPARRGPPTRPEAGRLASPGWPAETNRSSPVVDVEDAVDHREILVGLVEREHPVQLLGDLGRRQVRPPPVAVPPVRPARARSTGRRGARAPG